MNLEYLIPVIAFILAAYSVIGNDVIQTLGTFLTSNKEKKWWILWLYASVILSGVLIYGWYQHSGDVSFGRLDQIPLPEDMPLWYLIPPVVLIILTRFGFPVSTTFLILSIFSSQAIIEKMILKSVLGYSLAFVFAFILYLVIARQIESKGSIHKLSKKKHKSRWLIAQWVSTGLLWIQWLIQDFANIFVYLPRKVGWEELLFSLLVILLLMAYLFKTRGGKIQGIVNSKSNTSQIRSATIIDLVYALILYFFSNYSNIPMSTTWVFIGILAGRELAINYRINKAEIKNSKLMIFKDLYKINVGLIVSILIAYLIGYLNAL